MANILSLLKSSTYQKKSVLEKLICHRLDITKTELFARSETDISSPDLDRIDTAYTSYISDHKPLEYILGYVHFADLKFHVNKNTLIPRPETEYMIDGVREYIQESITKTPHTMYNLLDIGTGCGVLGTSILHHCGTHISHAVLADLSPEALEVATKNYNTHIGTSRAGQDKLVISNLLDHQDIYTLLSSPLPRTTNEESLGEGLGARVIIVANLPYIPDELFDKNADPTVHDREPRMAFVGGDDGLDLYRVMFGQLISRQTKHKDSPLLLEQGEFRLKRKRERPGSEGLGVRVIFFLEMMTRQVDILRKEYPDRVFEEIKTFHFNIRIVRVLV